jgi:hypothetical protein
MLVVIFSPRKRYYSIPSMVTKRRQCLFEITGKDPILKNPFLVKLERKDLPFRQKDVQKWREIEDQTLGNVG